MHNIVKTYAWTEPHVNFIKSGFPFRLNLRTLSQMLCKTSTNNDTTDFNYATYTVNMHENVPSKFHCYEQCRLLKLVCFVYSIYPTYHNSPGGSTSSRQRW